MNMPANPGNRASRACTNPACEELAMVDAMAFSLLNLAGAFAVPAFS